MTSAAPSKEKLGPRAGRTSSRLIEIPAIAVTFLMMIHVSINAILRTFSNEPLDNTLEITSYWYMPIIVFIGFIAAQTRKEHIKADFIYNLLPPITRPYVLGMGYALVTIVSIGFAWFGLGEALAALEVQRVAGTSSVPAWPTYFLPPTSFGVLAAQFAVLSLQSLRGQVEPDGDEMVQLEESK